MMTIEKNKQINKNEGDTMYWAHSPKPELNIPGQTYKDHIENVYNLAVQNANSATFFSPKLNEQLLTIVKQVACFHDLGKLYPENQSILSGEQTAEHLPIIHPFAGAHYLYDKNGAASFLINHLS